MLYIAIPLIAGGLIGLVAGHSKKLFPLALAGAVGGLLWWASTITPINDIFAAFGKSGVKDTLATLYGKASEPEQMALQLGPLGMIVGFILGKFLASRKVKGKTEDKRSRKLRILKEHGMTEFN